MAVRDVEGDSRRVRIFAKYVREECRGRLPRTNDLAELAGWEREGASVAQVRVGRWWHDFSTMNDGARKKRVEESARDEPTQQALRDLAQCEKRDSGHRDVEGDSRRVRILAKYVREKCRGQLPPHKHRAELAGWEREGAGVAQVAVGQWWYRFSSKNDGARKKRVEESARDEATQQALRDLAECEKRDSGNRDVKGDSRRVRILAKYVLEKCGGQLPQDKDVAELAGWEHEDAVVAQVQVGRWWYNFSSANKGERKKRVAESAPDEATKKALQYLAQCPMRDHGKRDVKGDSRRVRILAKYVLEECHGRLPRRNDLAELAGWEHEDADLAQVKVGDWWRNFSIKNDGDRKKRVEESAPDEATQEALQYLAQCPMRDKENARFWRDVKGDSRRVRIFANVLR
jgi:predicted RNA-binding protein